MGSCTNMRTIFRLQSSVGITGIPLDYGLLSMYWQYKQVIFDYRKFRKNASTTRTTFQYERIEELALADNVEAYVVRKNIKNLETTRAQSRGIQSMLGSRRGTGVTQV